MTSQSDDADRGPSTAQGTASDTAARPVLFDMDGVILRGRATASSVYDRATDRAIAALRADPSSDQWDRLRTFEWAEVADACADLDVDARAFWRYREEYATDLAVERIRSGERAAHDCLASVRELAGTRPSAIVSNNRHGTVAFVAGHFDLPVGTVRGRGQTPEDFARRKPAPHFLEEALGELGVETGLYVGDRASDVEAARRAGLDAVYVRRSHNEDRPVPLGAVCAVSSVADVAALLE